MFLNDEPPIAGGRELWGFPKKLAEPELARRDRHAGRHARLRPVRVATGDDGLQAPRRPISPRSRPRSRRRTSCSRSFPHVDGTPRICELVEYYLRGRRP